MKTCAIPLFCDNMQTVMRPLFVVSSQAKMASVDNAAISRRTILPTTDESRAHGLGLWNCLGKIPRPADAGTPSDRVKMLRDAFVKTLSHSAVLDETKKGRIDIDPATAPSFISSDIKLQPSCDDSERLSHRSFFHKE